MSAVVINMNKDDNAKEWRSTALRARARRSSPIIGMIALLFFVSTVVTFAAMADEKPARLTETKEVTTAGGVEEMRRLEDRKEKSSVLETVSSPESMDIENDTLSTRDIPGLLSERQQAVRDAIRWAYTGYRDHAFGYDELKPLSKQGHNWLGQSHDKGLGMTLIDSLDTLWLIGDKEEFDDACLWICKHLNVNQNVEVNVFETTIRVLGGLLSAYSLSGKRILLEKSIELGLALAPAFESLSGIPFSDVNLGTGKAFNPHGGDSSLAEATSLQLEFKFLAHLMNNNDQAVKLKNYADRSMKRIYAARSEVDNEYSRSGLLPIYVDPDTGYFQDDAHITIGARGDSYYEYLLKQWLQTDKLESRYLHEYVLAIKGIRKHLVRTAGGFTYVGELLSGRNFSPKMDHLACFLPGTLALGHLSGADDSPGLEHLELAKRLMNTCVQGYKQTPSGLAPEIWWFNDDGLSIHPNDNFSLLRPETVESLFYLWRATHDDRYRDWGWDIFLAFERHAKVASGGYASLSSIDSSSPSKRDKMESFWIAETLKYLFLLFDDQDLLPLHKVVFNTEAHPLPIFLSDMEV